MSSKPSIWGPGVLLAPEDVGELAFAFCTLIEL